MLSSSEVIENYPLPLEGPGVTPDDYYSLLIERGLQGKSVPQVRTIKHPITGEYFYLLPFGIKYFGDEFSNLRCPGCHKYNVHSVADTSIACQGRKVLTQNLRASDFPYIRTKGLTFKSFLVERQRALVHSSSRTNLYKLLHNDEILEAMFRYNMYFTKQSNLISVITDWMKKSLTPKQIVYFQVPLPERPPELEICSQYVRLESTYDSKNGLSPSVYVRSQSRYTGSRWTSTRLFLKWSLQIGFYPLRARLVFLPG